MQVSPWCDLSVVHHRGQADHRVDAGSTAAEIRRPTRDHSQVSLACTAGLVRVRIQASCEGRLESTEAFVYRRIEDRLSDNLGYSARMNDTMPSVGAHASISHTVTEADIAHTLGTGHVPVLASSRLLTWAEGATCAAIDADLDESLTSVGTRLELQHEGASALDATVVVRAELTAVDGRELVFEFQAAHEDGQVVGRGRVSRVVVNRQRFLERAVPGS